MSLFSNENLGNLTKVNGQVIQNSEPINTWLTASSVSTIAFVVPAGSGTYQIQSVQSGFSTASSSGTVTVEVLTGTTAPGSGTSVTSAIALSGTANTVVNTTPTSFPILAAGTRVNLKVAGTMTSLAGGFVQLVVVRLS